MDSVILFSKIKDNSMTEVINLLKVAIKLKYQYRIVDYFESKSGLDIIIESIENIEYDGIEMTQATAYIMVFSEEARTSEESLFISDARWYPAIDIACRVSFFKLSIIEELMTQNPSQYICINTTGRIMSLRELQEARINQDYNWAYKEKNK